MVKKMYGQFFYSKNLPPVRVSRRYAICEYAGTVNMWQGGVLLHCEPRPAH